jgi:plasmid stabilization system protein ParE
VEYLPKFDIDLEEAEAWLDEFSATASDRLTNTIDKKVSLLVKHPMMYPVYHNSPYRFIPLPYKFLLFYQIDDARRKINVHRIIHGTKDLSKALKN